MIYLKTPEEILKMRAGGKILALVMKKISEAVKIGIALKDLDKLARELITKAGAQPAFLGYRPYGAKKPYPCSICTSINEVVVHGVPGRYRLKASDLLKLDFGVLYEGYYTDAALTMEMKELPVLAKKLIIVTQLALKLAIEQCQPGKHLGDIGFVISNIAKKNNFRVIKTLTGHGIGKHLHEDPDVFNEGQKGRGLKFEPGMVLAIEPMICVGSGQVIQQLDNSYITADNSLAAHFEHTVAITKKGPQVLTEL